VKIKLHIERLVLDGLPVDRTQSGRVSAAVKKELTRLLSAGGLSPELSSAGVVPALQGGSMKVEKRNEAGQLGKNIARAVHAGIGRHP
jgi:hypothetical protein